MKKNIIKYIIVIILVIAGFTADYQSKKWAEYNLKGNETITAIDGFLKFSYTQNKGMIFGILNGKIGDSAGNILTGLRMVILICLSAYIWIRRDRSFLFLLPFILFWAGAVGNLVDPFVYGYVVDFIIMHIGGFVSYPFIFNLADAYVTIGYFFIFINFVLLRNREEMRNL